MIYEIDTQILEISASGFRLGLYNWESYLEFYPIGVHVFDLMLSQNIWQEGILTASIKTKSRCNISRTTDTIISQVDAFKFTKAAALFNAANLSMKISEIYAHPYEIQPMPDDGIRILILSVAAHLN